ncbi:hypothetical protein EXU48_03230 [Occultella glacieicola]|uniref:Uncharacterized protein n=1 Tax=Occultella glacieicola TaxID=2518684 RepID=A0ABY2E6R6_9MICO|nr:hypothetical protein [Occultella glacieicola]TDE97237.1 hypothetical protein EXU48_03230 [Occultella glacieicola]
MSDNNSTLLRAVQQLDPQANPDPVDSDALLARVRLAIADAPAEMPDLAPRPVPRTTRRVVVGAAATILLGAAVYTVANPAQPPAYASWTPTPTELTAPVAAERAVECPTVEVMQGPPEDPTDMTDIPLTMNLAEERGDYTFAVSSGVGAEGESAYSVCLIEPDRITAQGEVLPADALTPPAASDVVVLNSSIDWSVSSEEDAITYLVGTAGADVTGIDVNAVAGSFAHASLADGWWAVWFPGDVDLTTDLTVTTSDGTTREVAAVPGSSDDTGDPEDTD